MFQRTFTACLLSFALAATACGARLEPVYDVHDHPIPAAAQRLPLDEIGQNIMVAAVQARWRVDPLGSGEIRAAYDTGKHDATVYIRYSQTAYSITLATTNNLLQQGGEVHRTYNSWVRKLEQDIQDRLMLAPRIARDAGTITPAAADRPKFGETVAFRCPAPGTTIEFLNGTKRVFTTDDGMHCPYDSAGEHRLVTLFGPYRAENAQALMALWPLKLGNEVSFAVRTGPRTYVHETFRVARRSAVTVKAGTFDAFVIEWKAVSNSTTLDGYGETGTFWYAPEVGYVVKTRHKLTGGAYARLGDDEAVRITAQ